MFSGISSLQMLHISATVCPGQTTGKQITHRDTFTTLAETLTKGWVQAADKDVEMIPGHREQTDAAKHRAGKYEGVRGGDPGLSVQYMQIFSNVNYNVNAAFMWLHKGRHNKAALLPFKHKHIKRVRDVKSQFFVPLLNQLHSVLLDDTATLQRPLSS